MLIYWLALDYWLFVYYLATYFYVYLEQVNTNDIDIANDSTQHMYNHILYKPRHSRNKPKPTPDYHPV